MGRTGSPSGGSSGSTSARKTNASVKLPEHQYCHRWARERVNFPSDDVESLQAEVAARARQRTAQRCSTPFDARAEPKGQGKFRSIWDRDDDPKYLSTACVSRGCDSRASTGRPPSRGASPGFPFQHQTPRQTPRQRRDSQNSLPNPTGQTAPGKTNGIDLDLPLKILTSPASAWIFTEEFGVTKVPARTWLLLESSSIFGFGEAEDYPPSSYQVPHGDVMSARNSIDGDMSPSANKLRNSAMLMRRLAPGGDDNSEDDNSCSGGLQNDAGGDHFFFRYKKVEDPQTIDVAELGDGCGKGYLASAAGGGLVINAPGTHLLRLVPKDRLQLTAAEANFRKAAHGNCVLALKHATVIAGLLKEQDAWLHHVHVEGDCLDTRHQVRLQPMAEPLGSDLLKTCIRARRMQEFVVNQAIAAEKRARVVADEREQALAALQESVSEDSQFQDPHDKAFMGGSELHSKSILHTGYTVLTNFMVFSKSRHGNVMRTWFLLDPEGRMGIGKMQFIRGVMEMGFQDNVHAMWTYLDNIQQKGTITILELDPPSAMLLARFKLLVTVNYGPCNPFNYFDENRSGKLFKHEFIDQLMILNYSGPAATLFDLLDRRGLGSIIASDFRWLETWKPPPYLFCKVDAVGLQAFKDALVALHDSLLRGWRKVLDVDSNMRISWQEFCMAFKELPLSALPDKVADKMPKTLQDIASAWRALDVDCAGWVALREFDSLAFTQLRAFKTWAVANHGGCVNAFHNLDNANGKLTLGELKRGLKGEQKHAFIGDIEFLYHALDVAGTGNLGEAEVKFLDLWDVSWEDWEVHSKHRMQLEHEGKAVKVTGALRNFLTKANIRDRRADNRMPDVDIGDLPPDTVNQEADRKTHLASNRKTQHTGSKQSQQSGGSKQSPPSGGNRQSQQSGRAQMLEFSRAGTLKGLADESDD